ncbi:MAG: tetratricopeptide repeat protein [Gammaproteobacteria bacterium]|nr:tetratricopeptide repeat protein [Gammaproteobacteria bacterium]MBT8151087.1 tetratricopeptide repeat protein [Gammaproteobacteria bacterium]NND39546.1 tetratricopeptide repeat protein [Pseudomonadales bacterium]NNM11840.1 tetratricopeptide repeat protein [Pseudomonadales bacterium]RZV53303.1 MAG: tetratricopeptide repeat protein [Pseudomonadales bacterium]
MKITLKKFGRTIAGSIVTLLPCLTLTTTANAATTAESGQGKPSPIMACYQSAYHASRSSNTGEYLSAAQLVSGTEACTQALRYYKMRKKVRAQVYLHRGLLNRHLLRSSLALKDFQRARRVGGDSPAISVNIGNIHYLNGKFERAISAYNRALQMEFPAAHKALLNRGLASERLGRSQHAIDAYIAALAIQPSLNVAKERLAALTKGKQRLSALPQDGTGHTQVLASNLYKAP